jgi:hypothetical protein
MRTRVSLSKDTAPTIPPEATPVCLRIQLSRATVKALHCHLPHASQRAEGRLVRRVPGWLALLGPQVPRAVLCARWGLRPSWLYAGQTACLRTRGFALHKARLGSAHRDTAKRLAWQPHAWPRMWRPAQQRKALMLCEEVARLAQGGSWRYPWARGGQQPAVPPRGRRPGYKVFGALEYCSGRLCSPGLEGRWPSERYHAFLQVLMGQTPAPLLGIPAGARYHPRQASAAFGGGP